MNSLYKNNLSSIFSGVAVKRLTAVEVESRTSNQHEFQGIGKLRDILGRPSEKKVFPAKFILVDDDEESMSLDSELTWYDARINQPHRSPEYRLYYPAVADQILHKCKPGDLIVFALHNNGFVYVFIASKDSVFENQLLWLFGVDESNGLFTRKDLSDRELFYASKFIIEKIGLEVPYHNDYWVEMLLSRFPDDFPTTTEFSTFARETVTDIDPCNDPDDSILKLIDHEEMLFRNYEKYKVDQILKTPFRDTDSFIQTALSIINRRKSRAGASLENQIEFVFKENKILYSRKNTTENKSSPDFLFPSNAKYRDFSFDSYLLSMLGVKRTCKDRWRQILSEADRIKVKHLFTLEPGISISQTNEMIYNNVQLVLPSKIHQTYSNAQQKNLFSLQNFIDEIRQKQSGL